MINMMRQTPNYKNNSIYTFILIEKVKGNTKISIKSEAEFKRSLKDE
jgi:hypothetical protein